MGGQRPIGGVSVHPGGLIVDDDSEPVGPSNAPRRASEAGQQATSRVG